MAETEDPRKEMHESLMKYIELDRKYKVKLPTADESLPT